MIVVKHIPGRGYLWLVDTATDGHLYSDADAALFIARAWFGPRVPALIFPRRPDA